LVETCLAKDFDEISNDAENKVLIQSRINEETGLTLIRSKGDIPFKLRDVMLTLNNNIMKMDFDTNLEQIEIREEIGLNTYALY
jgi:hypothetical protein